jgi:hypothetical protein
VGRKSLIDRATPGVRAHILKRLRENRLTLDELMAELAAMFPVEAAAGALPSRSGVGRYAQAEREIIKEQREQALLGDRVVEALGEDKDSKRGALLSQTLTMLMNRTLLSRMEKGEELEIADLLALARASKAAQETSSLNLRERQNVEKAAREKLLEEQKASLQALAVKGGVTPETQAAIRQALGIG